MLRLCAACVSPCVFGLFFFNVPAPTEIYTLSLHDALPICAGCGEKAALARRGRAERAGPRCGDRALPQVDRKSTRLNSSHTVISYAVFCLKKKKKKNPKYSPSTIRKTHLSSQTTPYSSAAQ